MSAISIRDVIVHNVQTNLDTPDMISPSTPIRQVSDKFAQHPIRRLTTIYTTASGESYIIIEHHNQNSLTPNSPDISIRYVRLTKTNIIHRQPATAGRPCDGYGAYSLSHPTDKAIVGKAVRVNKHDLRYVEKQVIQDFYTNYVLEYRDTMYV